ncbi:MAG: thioredoxin family protein [Alicyclobacillaceae bacterium]|jgi:thiol-disulfide isomerase/thioredoxin|uniref:thioredoxin family protein n=1 Tax=Alicyclobacillus sp. SP_1 TaxID=2942475 RepID=UPI002157838F|nr:thioredoxin family protein [Alicyclobacillus sp. SP_1]MCY0887892.1 thioredoxin family protein [Alicyclobacillaceae bacterium]MCY0896269.1 thioredoxin family protein [Alicyclobacillaceae bacterium]
MMEIKTESEFVEFLKKGRTVVECYTTWCPDCRRVEPYFPEWEKRYGDKFELARMNCEEVPEIAERYEVRGIPTFLAFENGELVTRLFSRDAKSKAQVETFLDAVFTEIGV